MLRRSTILLMGLLFAVTAFSTSAQEANLQGEHDITVGLLGIDAKGTAYLVDLSRRDPETNAPYLIYFPKATEYGLKIGKTYSAHINGYSDLSIVVNGVLIHPKPTLFSGNVSIWNCQKRPAPEGGHWEWLPEGNGSGGNLACKPGVKETVKWKADKASRQETARSNQRSNVPPCDLLQQPFHDTLLTVVITVTPESNLQWTFPEAPSHVAQRILADLNANRRNITFKEASGVVPNLYINVTVNETSSGTKQDTAYAVVTGLGKTGTLFSVNSGQAPFVGLAETIDHLSINMLTWFEGGWHRPGPCVAPNGEVLP